MRKITRKGIIRKLDALCKMIVIARDGHCVTCYSSKNLTPGHLFSRIAHSTRWDLNNIFCQCASCNFKHERDSYPFNNWYIQRFGKEEWDKLHVKYSKTRPYKTYELISLHDELNKEYAILL